MIEPKEFSATLDEFDGCGTYEWHVVENRVVWSAGLLSLYGITRAPSAEEGFTSLVHPDDRTRVEAETSGYLDAADSYQHEFRILRPSGEVRHIHDRGLIERGPDGTACVLRGLNVDVTDQRLAQAAEDETRINTAFGIGFYDHEVAQGRSRWSAGMFDLLELPPAETVDPNMARRVRVHEDDQERMAALQTAASRRPGSFEIEYRVRRSDGNIRWIRDSGKSIGPVNPATGLVWRIRGTLTDVTELKSATPAALPGTEIFRQIIDGTPWGIVVIDADFRLIAASRAARPAFGEEEPGIGRDYAVQLRRIWPEPFANIVIERFRHTLETGQPYRSAFTAEQRADNEQTEVYEWYLEQIRLPDGRPGVACYFFDLTERARQEAALRESEERLKMAYEASEMGAWDLNLVTGAAIWSPQLYALLGLNPQTLASGDLFYSHVHPDDVPGLKAAVARSIETGEILETGFRIRRADGAVRHLASRGRIVRQEDGLPTRMIGVNFDVTERRRLERRIRESEQELRLVLDSTLAFVGVLQPDGTLVEANATALAAGGLKREDVLGRRFWEAPWWSYDPDVADHVRAAIETARSGEVVRYDAVVRMRDDALVTIDFLLSPILDDAGRVRRIVASAFDITERKEAMERVQMLMQEINHRSKNTLALVQAVARQIWRSSPDDFFDRFANRLRALAASQDLLVAGARDGALLEDVARAQLAHFGELLETRIRLDGPPVGLKADAAQTMGMAFHELATNASKYGALSAPSGEVEVSWSVQDGHLRVFWVERGGPPVEPPERTGFGTVVLETILQGSLGGEVEIVYAHDGMRWTLVCPDGCLIP